jgi:MinD-like ATPase involved in chromosome partitioning or flagellar assembly
MGTIVTFYSYKGGVGRTMALANIAVLLSQWGKKVLVVDWDLEAPGLEHFFFKGEELGEVQRKGGITDILHWADSTEMYPPATWHWSALTVDVFTGGRTPLALLTAGARHDGDYFRGVHTLDVESFYEHRQGGHFIESLRSEWKEHFDFVLVDSRTGITDIGGICTIQLPDIMALIFTATVQSLTGAVAVARKAAAERQKLPFDRPLVPIVPLPSKFDTQTERDVSQRWLDRFVQETAWMYRPWLPQGVNHREFLELTKIPYTSYFSFGEGLPVIEQGTTDPTGLGFAYETVAAVIGNELQHADLLLSNRDDFIRTVSATTALPRTPLRETSKNVVVLLDCAAASLLRTSSGETTSTSEDDHRWLERYELVIAKMGKRFNADILMSDGDRVLFGFSDAVQAVQCTLGIQEQLAIGQPLVTRVGALRARFAIHATNSERPPNSGVRQTFAEAARALGVAKDGQVLITATACDGLSPAPENVRLVALKEPIEFARGDGTVEFLRLFEVIGLIVVHLTDAERKALLQQDPKTKSLGGFQAFLVNLQKKVQGDTNRLALTIRDRERIARYAHDYRSGGWQARLKKTFGRSLGADLGRAVTSR